MPGHTDSAWSAALVAGVGPYELTNGGERRRKGDLSGDPDTQHMKSEEMDLILRFRCDSCHKEFTVADERGPGPRRPGSQHHDQDVPRLHHRCPGRDPRGHRRAGLKTARGCPA